MGIQIILVYMIHIPDENQICAFTGFDGIAGELITDTTQFILREVSVINGYCIV